MNTPIAVPCLSVRANKMVFAVTALLFYVIFAFIASAEPAAAVTCTDSLQAEIDAVPSGGTVTAEPCIYREQVKITKPLTLLGKPGSEIRGSNVWSTWDKVAAGWRSRNTLPLFPQEDVSCEPNTQRCAWPEQVFMNGVALVQVAPSATLSTGKFKLDSARRVILSNDPRRKTMEVTVRRHWITGTSGADGVTIRGFTMKHAANEWRSGAIQSRPPTTQNLDGTYAWSRFKADGDDWNVVNNILSDAHGAVVSVRSRNADILNNEIARGGQLGIHNPGDFSHVQGNHIHENNTERFCIAYGNCVGYSTDGNSTILPTLVESGGVKIAGGQDNISVEDNVIDHNRGQGLWFDVQTHDMVIAHNRIHHNARRGIFFEISDGAKIFDNTIYENGWATPEYVDGAGIQVGNSSNVEVYNNTLAWNADGIAVVGLDREGTANDNVTNVYVHDNTILQEDTNVAGDSKTVALGWIEGWTTQMFQPVANNRGADNRYYYPTSEGRPRYEWSQTRYSSLMVFESTPGDENGNYLTKSEKDALVASKEIPASPEPH
jgi:hypothetical protein